MAATDTAEAAARHRSVGVWGAAALVAGSMVGSGVYVLPATLAAVGSISILGWIAATLTALAIGGVFVLLSPLVPRAEGLPDYVRAGRLIAPFGFRRAESAFALLAAPGVNSRALDQFRTWLIAEGAKTPAPPS